jgi:hypothetical protein
MTHHYEKQQQSSKKHAELHAQLHMHARLRKLATLTCSRRHTQVYVCSQITNALSQLSESPLLP